MVSALNFNAEIAHSMNVPQVPAPLNTGWADFGKKTSANVVDNTENMFDFCKFEEPVPEKRKDDSDSWFDFAEGFGTSSTQNKNQVFIHHESFINFSL